MLDIILFFGGNDAPYRGSLTLALESKSSPGFIFSRIIGAADWPDWLHT